MRKKLQHLKYMLDSGSTVSLLLVEQFSSGLQCFHVRVVKQHALAVDDSLSYHVHCLLVLSICQTHHRDLAQCPNDACTRSKLLSIIAGSLFALYVTFAVE